MAIPLSRTTIKLGCKSILLWVTTHYGKDTLAVDKQALAEAWEQHIQNIPMEFASNWFEADYVVRFRKDFVEVRCASGGDPKILQYAGRLMSISDDIVQHILDSVIVTSELGIRA